MVLTIIKKSIEFTFRKYINMKMTTRHITTHFVVEGHRMLLSITSLLHEASEEVIFVSDDVSRCLWNAWGQMARDVGW